MRPRRVFSALACLSVLLGAAGPGAARVKLGIDVLRESGFAQLQGKTVGLITNHTGRDARGRSTIDLLARAPGVKLAALFSPEHGPRGDRSHGEAVAGGVDPKTGIKIYSLYGKTKRPEPGMLENLDALVFDIQDAGTRFYTYITTLAMALEEAAKAGIEMIVLDRPNPITGSIVAGETLDPRFRHFTAYLEVPVRHGMTVGELARWYNETAGLGADLTVVKMEGWRRDMWWDETGIPFRAASPNIRDLRAALLYPGVGAFEATNVSVGRGTRHPFEFLGAPWIDGEDLAERLDFAGLPGMKIRPAKFKPSSDLYAGEVCRGVRIAVTDRDRARPVELFLQAFFILAEKYPDRFVPRWKEIPYVTGSDLLERSMAQGQTAEGVIFLTDEKAAAFTEARKSALIYE